MGTETVNGVSCEKSKIIMTKLDDGSKMGGFFTINTDGSVSVTDGESKIENVAGVSRLIGGLGNDTVSWIIGFWRWLCGGKIKT